MHTKRTGSSTVTGLTLRGIAKRFHDVQALAPLDLDIGEGQFVSVLGPSGCGKTTLLRCLAGLETPDAGTIDFGERTVFDDRRGLALAPHKRGIGMVFQDLALWPHMSVFDNVAYTLRARRDTTDLADRVRDALDLVRLPGHAGRRPHQLSGGQQQRVAFARAIVDRPPLLLMDEPLSALDASLRIELRQELTALTRELGVTAVYVTHDQGEAMSMSDRVLVMEGGHVRQDGPPEEIYQRPANRFVAAFVGHLNSFDTPLAARVPSANGARSVNGARSDTANGAPPGSAVGNGAPPGSAIGNGASPTGAAHGAGVRPEKVRLHPQGGDEVTLAARVELASYLGGHYELRCRVDASPHPWVVLSDHRVEVGGRLTLHVAAQDLIVTSG